MACVWMHLVHTLYLFMILADIVTNGRASLQSGLFLPLLLQCKE